MLSNEALMEILHTKYEIFSVDDVVEMIEDELAKPKSEIDAEFLTVCLDGLSYAVEKGENEVKLLY